MSFWGKNFWRKKGLRSAKKRRGRKEPEKDRERGDLGERTGLKKKFRIGRNRNEIDSRKKKKGQSTESLEQGRL